ncbi:hypothetical protein KR222_000452 [Zaprionus bogoriensis]|nr:hypothetical protein KR222_000452 [Zaprionus bogoriensis]
MPKRGGGGGQRYNNNAGSNGVYYKMQSVSLSLADVEDHQRRKDRNKRRVSFKTSQFPHKSDVKLRVQDVRRWDEDDDMSEMTTTVKDRPSSRRRGSPIPRGKFGKLVPSSLGWYQITIHNGQIYDKDTLLRSLLAAMSPHVFIPQYWRAERSCVIFFTDDFEVAERIQQLGRHAQLPDGFRLMPRVRTGIPLVTIDDEMKSKLKQVMSKRYNEQTKALDLTRFHTDADLKPIFCPLFRVGVMSAALDIISEYIPDLEAINLNDNQMSTMEAFKGAEKRVPNLKILYLGDNKLTSLAHLMVFRQLPIVELVLRNNPCRLRYKDPQQYVSEVRRKFPKLMKLDGQTLTPQTTFDMSESAVLPPGKASFLCDSAGAEVVRQFLEQYFNIFDSGNRQPLLDAYHELALLSMSMPSANQAGSRLNNFWKFNRNLRRIVSNERDDLRTRLLKSGRLACVSCLDEWPRTLHERSTFTVDLTIFNVSGCNCTRSLCICYSIQHDVLLSPLPLQPQMIVFTITGLFKELSENADSSIPVAAQTYELRHFMRTFVVVPQNSGFCIRNETIFITSASAEQTREFKRSQHQPAPGADIRSSLNAMPTAAALGADKLLQSRLQQAQAQAPMGQVALLPPPSIGLGGGVTDSAAPVAPAAAPAVPVGADSDATKMQMVQAMSVHSQMNVEWSRKCLEETNWDFNHAAFVFNKLFKENKIPPEAFIK